MGEPNPDEYSPITLSTNTFKQLNLTTIFKKKYQITQAQSTYILVKYQIYMSTVHFSRKIVLVQKPYYKLYKIMRPLEEIEANI